jgi:asparagine N-glycosylation enzyme membrane subunit Stt3
VSSETHAGFREQSFGSLQRRRAMLYTIAVILLILWLLGFVSGYTIGAFIHVLLVIALVLLLVQFLSGRRVV